MLQESPAIEDPIFEVRVYNAMGKKVEKTFKIWASGKIEGFPTKGRRYGITNQYPGEIATILSRALTERDERQIHEACRDLGRLSKKLSHYHKGRARMGSWGGLL